MQRPGDRKGIAICKAKKETRVAVYDHGGENIKDEFREIRKTGSWCAFEEYGSYVSIMQA